MEPNPLMEGGGEDVPIELDTLLFASARTQEIASLSRALDESKKNCVLFQRLPRHMRRRAMSHNPKRMPRNLREGHKHQIVKSSGGPNVPQKKPSRKHRRRPNNLLEEYNRRQRSFVWLETHIWHAKRFHMTERWGYRLADFPNDRSYRACYRAAANHCLMQDVSFLGCIELTGALQTLLTGLSKHTNSCAGLTFGAQSLLDGSREGNLMFYESDQYPWKPVGSVSFFWKPNRTSPFSDVRSLWIWAHPAFYARIVDALMITFQLKLEPDLKEEVCVEDGERSNDEMSSPKKKLKLNNGEGKNVEEMKLALRNVPFERTPKFKNMSGSVEMICLKDTLNRFRLTGPLSQQVVMEALQPVNNIDGKSCAASNPALISNTRSNQDNLKFMTKAITSQELFRDFADTDVEGRESHGTFWLSNCAVSPAELPPRMILCLTVKDPRLYIPDKRTKAYPKRAEVRVSTPLHSPPLPYSSPLWSASIRDRVTKSKLSTAELNALRSKCLVPGTVRTNEEYESSQDAPGSKLEASVNTIVPVMLVQRPGSQDPLTKRLGFGCGWDIIFPAGWAMPFWLALTFRCAKASGIREASAHNLERGLCDFIPPDSAAGFEEELRKGKELRATYFRLPPAKRPNYIKLGVACPFQCEWFNLIRDWTAQDGSPSSEQKSLQSDSFDSSFFVLRDPNIIWELNRFLTETWSALQKQNCGNHNAQLYETLAAKLPTFAHQGSCLLAVQVEALQKGVTDDMSLICLPTPEDVVNIRNSLQENILVESSRTDKSHEERLRLRKEHKKLLLRLRKRRVRAKKKGDENKSTEEFSDFVKVGGSSSSPTQDLVASHNQKMEELWLCDTSVHGSVRYSGSRETAGFVTKGNFSFTEARGCGVGYITYLCLQKLLKVWQMDCGVGDSSHLKSAGFVVLVRSSKSFQYRLAKLSLILDR